MNKNKISVVIITRNRPQFLQEAIASLCKQARMPDEVIIVDNDSYCNIRGVLEPYSNQLNIKYVLEKTVGIPFARNAGVKNASGDIIAFMDDDCTADKSWLEMLERPFLKDPQIGMVGGGISYKRHSSSSVEKFLNENMCKGQNIIFEEKEG